MTEILEETHSFDPVLEAAREIRNLQAQGVSTETFTQSLPDDVRKEAVFTASAPTIL